MKELKFVVPDYIEDEIKIFLWKKKNKKGCTATFYNILALIGLAVVNKKISSKQAERIKAELYKMK